MSQPFRWQLRWDEPLKMLYVFAEVPYVATSVAGVDEVASVFATLCKQEAGVPANLVQWSRPHTRGRRVDCLLVALVRPAGGQECHLEPGLQPIADCKVTAEHKSQFNAPEWVIKRALELHATACCLCGQRNSEKKEEEEEEEEEGESEDEEVRVIGEDQNGRRVSITLDELELSKKEDALTFSRPMSKRSVPGANKSKIKFKTLPDAVKFASAMNNTVTMLLERGNVKNEVLARMTTQDEVQRLIAEEVTPHIARWVFEMTRSADTHKHLGDFEENLQCSNSRRVGNRGDFRQTLRTQIGPAPPDRSWKDEFDDLVADGCAMLSKKRDPHLESVATFTDWVKKMFPKAVERLGSLEKATCLGLLMSSKIITPLAKAIEERDSRYAATSHAVYSIIAALASEGKLAPKCYRHLRGKGGLADSDPRWETITKPDANGFMGMTSFAPLKLKAPQKILHDERGLKVGGEVMDCPVVCFESGEPEGFPPQVLHSAVMFSGANYLLPPLTLLRVVGVKRDGFEYMGKRVNQDLITVCPMYLLPAVGDKDSANGNSKFAADRTFLQYGNSNDSVRGLTDITTDPVLTMEQEFARNDEWSDWTGRRYSAWAEWMYVINPVPAPDDRVTEIKEEDAMEHSGSGSASPTPTPTASEGVGMRDQDKEGWLPARFRESINGFIEKQIALLALKEATARKEKAEAEKAEAEERRGGKQAANVEASKSAQAKQKQTVSGTGGLFKIDSGVSVNAETAAEETEIAVEETKTPFRKLSRTRTSIQLLLNTDAEVQKDVYLLTLAEVLAIRLYTGPAYVPINAFLREVAKVSPDWRQKLSHMHSLTYSSTVYHLTNGLRKLVRVNSSFDTVYRSVRGELPEAFWLRDEFGFVTATDFAFMSTSLNQDVCTHYMDNKGANVLWEIRCSEETSDGFHSGADVSLLSQYPQEREILFPPLTMLKVEPETEALYREAQAAGDRIEGNVADPLPLDVREIDDTIDDTIPSSRNGSENGNSNKKGKKSISIRPLLRQESEDRLPTVEYSPRTAARRRSINLTMKGKGTNGAEFIRVAVRPTFV